MEYNYRVTDAFVKVYSEAVRWHYFGEEPPGGFKKPHKSVVSLFWPREYPTGEERSAFLTGNLHRVPLLKRGTTHVPTYLEYDYPFNVVVEPSDKPRPEPDAEILPVVRPVSVPPLQGNTGPNRGFARWGRQLAQAGHVLQTAEPTNASSYHEARQPTRGRYGRRGRWGRQDTLPPRVNRPEAQTLKGGNSMGDWQLAHHDAQQPVYEGYGRGGRQAAPASWAKQPEAYTPEGGKQSKTQTPKGVKQSENWQPPRANYRNRQRQPAYRGSRHGRRPYPSNSQMGRQHPAEAERRVSPPLYPTPARLGPYHVHEAPAEAERRVPPPPNPTPARLGPYRVHEAPAEAERRGPSAHHPAPTRLGSYRVQEAGSTGPGYGSRRSSAVPASSDDDDTRYVPVPRGYYQRLSDPEPEREDSARREEDTGGEDDSARSEEDTWEEELTAEAVRVKVTAPKSRAAATSEEDWWSLPAAPAAKSAKAQPACSDWW
ncbi:hypothetical protein MMC32_007650 [Xylographa parallela]|nr:hypothetical protein [Xylographa parallela]